MEPDRPELYQRFLGAFSLIYSPVQGSPPVEETFPPFYETMKDIFKDDQDLLEKLSVFIPPHLNLVETQS
jgi:hypothetical protein